MVEEPMVQDQTGEQRSKVEGPCNAKITRPVRKVAVTLMELQTAEREVLRLFNVSIFTKNFKF